MKEKCHHCGKKPKEFCFSVKFNATFCSHDCYVDYRKSLDPNWKDQPIVTTRPREQHHD